MFVGGNAIQSDVGIYNSISHVVCCLLSLFSHLDLYMLYICSIHLSPCDLRLNNVCMYSFKSMNQPRRERIECCKAPSILPTEYVDHWDPGMHRNWRPIPSVLGDVEEINN